ncbi:3'(2'),5'-bisphosphate nucleotidase CysQ [Legionella israelensis]|uniref:3'(2'),5'-bisphosphate nucleotidase CysQ family protein n=1 Tax=Legionella israelensis TaxID=454 RepID=UPI00117C3842|nr:3'(2'),5'-bisphosphate nucleotidase CysQ [Legionella israelensis]QDP71169.1 3'(2'),5'-bisphosphate nucleotidase CysQ [Legionella israelensis]
MSNEHTMNFILDKELKTVMPLVQEAGKLARSIRTGHYKVHYKEKSQGPVTDADHAVSELLLEKIGREFPDDLLISEEASQHEGAAQSERIWFIDPIDGTKEFIENRDEWSIMVGLAINGVACLGVVYQPDRDKLYYSAKNKGSFLKTPQGFKTLKIRSVSQPEEAVLIQSRSHWSSKVDDVAKALGISRTSKLGSIGLKLGKIAEGKADLYLNFSCHCHLWDLCAPEAILTEAGGLLILSSGEAPFYGSEEMQMKKSFLATNKQLLDKVYPFLK